MTQVKTCQAGGPETEAETQVIYMYLRFLCLFPCTCAIVTVPVLVLVPVTVLIYVPYLLCCNSLTSTCTCASSCAFTYYVVLRYLYSYLG